MMRTILVPAVLAALLGLLASPRYTPTARAG